MNKVEKVFELMNLGQFGFELSNDDVNINQVGENWHLVTTKDGYTETYVAKSENACKSKFTRDYGKGAEWQKIAEKKVSRGRPPKAKPEPLQQEVFDGFEVEPDETEKEAAKIKEKSPQQKKEVAKTVAPLKTSDPIGMADFGEEVAELLAQCQSVKLIQNDEDNQLATETATKLNKLMKKIDESRLDVNRPLQDAIKSNNAIAKTMTDPIEKEIARIKPQITAYETEKERQRQEELAKIEAQKLQAEKLKQAEANRIARITGSIDKMEQDLTSKIEAVRTTEGLNILKEKLSEWTPKEEYYQEFLPNVEQLVKDLEAKIESRYATVLQLEAAVEQGNAKEAQEAQERIEKINQEQKQQAGEKQEEQETDDFKARQQLIMLFGQMGVDNVADSVEEVISAYGSAKIAWEHKDDMIQAYQAQKEAAEKAEELKNGGMKNQRISFSYQIIDKSKIPLEYMAVDEVKIRAALKANGQALAQDMDSFKIEGVLIKKELKTVLR